MDHQQQQQQQQPLLLLKTIQEETKRRVVSFKRSVRMKLTRHHNDYTNKEYHACYYSSEEYQHFKEDVLSTTQLIEVQLPDTIDESTRSRRGLECRTFLGRQQRRRNREEAKLAVFKLQEFYDQEHQDASHCNDNDVDDLTQKIATKYSEMTKSSRVVAHLIGLSDEREIYYHCHEEQPLVDVFQPHIITLPRKKRRSFEKEQRTTSTTIRVLQRRNRSNSLDSPPLLKPSVSSSRCWCSSCPTKEGCCNNKISITSNNTSRCTTTIASTSTTTTRNSLHQLLKYTSLSSSSSSSNNSDDSSDDDEDKPSVFNNDEDKQQATTNAKNTTSLLFANDVANAQSISQQVLDLMT